MREGGIGIRVGYCREGAESVTQRRPLHPTLPGSLTHLGQWGRQWRHSWLRCLYLLCKERGERVVRTSYQSSLQPVYSLPIGPDHMASCWLANFQKPGMSREQFSLFQIVLRAGQLRQISSKEDTKTYQPPWEKSFICRLDNVATRLEPRLDFYLVQSGVRLFIIWADIARMSWEERNYSMK